MARPIRKNLLDFIHDADAPGNAKFEALRNHYGDGDHGRAMEQRFWQLNCMIAKADGCRLELTRLPIRNKAITDLELSETDFNEFISFLSDPVRCDLLQNDQGVIWTRRLQEELESANEAREAERRRKQVEREARRNRKAGVVTGISGGKPSIVTPLSGGKPELSRGNPEENTIVRPESGGKGGLSGVLSGPLPSSPVHSSPAAGTNDDTSATPEDVTDPRTEPRAAASFPLTLKTRLAAAGIELAPEDFNAVASRLIAASCDCEAFLAWALKKCKGKEKPGVYLLTGILKYQWPEQWRKEKGSSCSDQKADPGKPQGNRFVPTPPPEEGTPEEQQRVMLEAALMQRKHNVLPTMLQCRALLNAREELSPAERRILVRAAAELTPDEQQLLEETAPPEPIPIVDTFEDDIPEEPA